MSRSRSRERGMAEFGSGWATGSRFSRADVDVRIWSTLGLIGAAAITPVHFAGRTATGQLIFLTAALVAALVTLGEAIYRGQRLDRVPLSLAIWWILGFGVALVQVAPLPADWLVWLSPRTWEVVKNVEHVPRLAESWKTLSLEPAGTLLGVATFCGYSLIFWTAWQVLRTPRDFQRVTWGVGLVLSAWALQGVAQQMLPNGRFCWLWPHSLRSADEYLCGPFSNRNHYAQFLSLGIGPLLWIGLHDRVGQADARPGRHRVGDPFPALRGWVAWGLAFWLIAVAFATSSRGGAVAIGCILSATVLLMALSRMISPGMLAGLALVVIAGGTLATQSSAGHSLAARLEKADTNSRWIIWKANWEVWQDFPWFGTGIGTHADAHLLKMKVVDPGRIFTHAESGYLQVASETGVAGLLVLGGILLTVLGRTAWAWSRQRSRAGWMAAAGLLTAFAGHLSHAAFDFFWYVPACMVIVTIWGTAACRLVSYRDDNWDIKSASTEPAAPSSRLRYVSTAAVVLVIAGWGIDQRLPSWRAESARESYLHLVHQEEVPASSTETAPEHDPVNIEKEKLRLLIDAAKFDGGNATLREAISLAHVKVHDAIQRESTDKWTLARIRQHLAEKLEGSFSQRSKTLQETIGSPAAHLVAARRHALTSVSRSPLKSNAWLQLARLSWLEDDAANVATERWQQAKRTVPFDGRVEFELGLDQLISGDPLRALETWEIACELTPPLRLKIFDLLGPKMPATILIERFHPALDDLIYLERKLRDWKRENQVPIVRETIVRHLVDRQAAGEELPPREWDILARCLLELERMTEAAEQTAAALEAHPQSFHLRRIRARILFEQGQFAESAEHYRWCLARQPDDEELELQAKAAIDAALRVTGNSAGTSIR